MNDLSWFLYFADILPNVGTALGLIGGLGLLAYAVITGIVAGHRDCSYGKYESNFHGVWWPIPVLVVIMTLSAFVPSKETIYLIAGSEAGEAVVTSPQGQEILNDVQEVIRAQLNNLKE